MKRIIAIVFLWTVMLAGFLAMPAAVFIGIDDVPMPAMEVSRKKSLARNVLLAGGGAALLAAIGLYANREPARLK